MTIECYNAECKFHSAQVEVDDGPFCYEDECKNAEVLEEIQQAQVVFEKLRKLCLDF